MQFMRIILALDRLADYPFRVGQRHQTYNVVRQACIHVGKLPKTSNHSIVKTLVVCWVCILLGVNVEHAWIWERLLMA